MSQTTVQDREQMKQRVQLSLERLLQGEGLDLSRIERFGSGLFDALATDDPRRVREMVIQALEDLPDTKYNDALRNAFGYKPGSALLLGLRREDLIRSFDEPISEATLRRWEQRAIPHLAQLLATDPKYHIGDSAVWHFDYVGPIAVPDEESRLVQELEQLRQIIREQSNVLKEIREILDERLK